MEKGGQRENKRPDIRRRLEMGIIERTKEKSAKRKTSENKEKNAEQKGTWWITTTVRDTQTPRDNRKKKVHRAEGRTQREA